MPAEFSWALPVLIGAAIVFFVDLIGNMLSFSNRFVNALVTSLVFAVIFGLVFYMGFATMTVAPIPAAN